MTAISSGWERRNPLLCNINTTAVKSQRRMNYLKHYCNLIRKAENRTPPEGYVERHHVFPISIYGKNNRIVILTAREHYIAHCLLEKACIKRYGKNHIFTEKMTYAHFLMNDGKRYYNSLLYEVVRKKVSEMHSKRFSGENNPRYGKIGIYKHTEETKEKQRKYNIKNNIKPPANGGWNKGKQHSKETRKKISEALKGKKPSEEQRKKQGEAKIGMKWWNNGIENKFTKFSPGKEWILGRINAKTTLGYSWWNNGQKNKYALECPGKDWKRGRLKKVNKTHEVNENASNTETTTVG